MLTSGKTTCFTNGVLVVEPSQVYVGLHVHLVHLNPRSALLCLLGVVL